MHRLFSSRCRFWVIRFLNSIPNPSPENISDFYRFSYQCSPNDLVILSQHSDKDRIDTILAQVTVPSSDVIRELAMIDDLECQPVEKENTRSWTLQTDKIRDIKDKISKIREIILSSSDCIHLNNLDEPPLKKDRHGRAGTNAIRQKS